MSPEDRGPAQVLGQCIKEIKEWMSQNFVQLNKDKTEVLVFEANEG